MSPVLRLNSIAIVAALTLALGASLSAQTPTTVASIDRVHLVAYHPECNPLARRFDPVWVNGWGWRMPRVGWHVLYPTANYTIARGLAGLGVNRKVAAIGATLGMGLIPHLRQAALGLKHGSVYELNAPDWVFDLWNRSLPSWAMLGGHDATRRDVALWFAGDVALSCFGSP
jgi:hypothetical protein